MDRTPPLTFLHSPLAICVLGFAASIGGTYVSLETRDTASATRIESLDARVATLERTSLPEAQFRDFQDSTSKRLDDIRQDLKLLLSRR